MATPDPSQNRASQSSDSPGLSASSATASAGSASAGQSSGSRAAPGASGGGGTDPASMKAGASATPSDREREIATTREGGTGTSSGMTKQDQSLAVRTPGAGMSPFTLMRRLSEDMDRMFGDFPFGGFFPSLVPTARRRTVLSNLFPGGDQPMWAPAVDVFQRGNDLVVHAELPGVSQKDISVEINDGMLTLSGHREQEKQDQRGDTYRTERSYGSFYRAIPLPDDADPNQAQAHFKDGVLEITVPVPERQRGAKGKKIEVQS
jgi:HSP20 family protein